VRSRHSWVAVAESGRQTSEPREISHEAGDPPIISFADYSQRSASQVLQEKARLTEAHSMHALFSVCSLRDDNVITSKRTWKLKHANSILEPSEYFCQISSKSIYIISSYIVSKLGHFLRHSVDFKMYVEMLWIHAASCTSCIHYMSLNVYVWALTLLPVTDEI